MVINIDPLGEGNFSPGVTFTILVNYKKSLTEMIRVGGYDSVDNDIAPEHFPPWGSGAVERELHLVRLNRALKKNIGEHKEKLDRSGFIFATVEDLLALGAAHPDLQRKFTIGVLGSQWQDQEGFSRIPEIGVYENIRWLRLSLVMDICLGYSWLLVVRKSLS